MTKAQRTEEFSAPPRGVRPKNRRYLIITAAADLFYERGYGQVSMSDVARAVNVAPSALYRHFASKSELLFEAVAVGLDEFTTALADAAAGDLSDMCGVLATFALDSRQTGVLWYRESRNLPDTDRERLRAKLRTAIRAMTATVQRSRPELGRGQAELLAACACDAMISISFHRLQLPRRPYESLLNSLAMRVVSLEQPGDGAVEADASRAARTVLARPRREELLAAASHLFAIRGFDAVSIDDIGAAVGIAGPSVYNHFASKQELLVALLSRGSEMLQMSMRQALADAGTSPIALRRLSDSFVDLSLDNIDLMTSLTAEISHLSEVDERRARRVQREYIDEWVAVLRAARPDEDLVVARIKVQAAQTVANTVGQTAHLRKVPGFRQTVREVCWAIQQ